MMNKRDFIKGACVVAAVPLLKPIVANAAIDDDLYWDVQWEIGVLEAEAALADKYDWIDGTLVHCCLDILHRIPKPV